MRPEIEIKQLREKLLAEAEVQRKLATKVSLQQKEIKLLTKDNDSSEKIRTEIYDLKAMSADPPEWIATPAGPHQPMTGVPMTNWSDWHHGEKVDKSQVGGKNEFNRKISRKRIQLLVNSTIDLTLNHMVKPEYPGIVICLGGDMITGAIHDDLKETNDGPVQVALLDVQEQLIAALTQMADNFGKVFVPCVVGNHGRTTLKPRAKDRVYTSYEWNLYCQLESHFRNDPRLIFFIPNEADARFTVLGHNFLLTHGDAIATHGGDGIIGAIGPIARGVKKLLLAEAQFGYRVDTVILGHFHAYMSRGDLIPAVENGSLIGFNEYAHLGLRVPASRPCQALWFIHEKRGFTASWPIYLDDYHKLKPKTWLTWDKAAARAAEAVRR
jgi:hypothetical protein